MDGPRVPRVRCEGGSDVDAPGRYRQAAPHASERRARVPSARAGRPPSLLLVRLGRPVAVPPPRCHRRPPPSPTRGPPRDGAGVRAHGFPVPHAGAGALSGRVGLLLVCLVWGVILGGCALAGKAYPSAWRAAVRCIHEHESAAWDRRTDWRGRPSVDHGGYQIALGTWASYAPPSFPRDPAAASRAQQTLVAWRIWRADGWSPWPNSSRACGLR
jgi:hypothetical protein